MNSNNSDSCNMEKTFPEERKGVLPGNLKENYWDGANNITPTDVRLFLGLFYEKRKNKGNFKRLYTIILDSSDSI